MCVSRVYMICNAYDSGVDHGFNDDWFVNPYKEGTDEYEAYDIGYEEGLNQKKEIKYLTSL